MVSDKIGQPLLYVIRHAEVADDVAGKIRGLKNMPLDDKGESQSDQLLSFFADRPLSAIYTDDLKRTQQTAEPVAKAKGIEVKIDIDLRSWDVGSDLEGKSIAANEEKIKKLKDEPWTVPVGGQSWADYQNQSNRAFDRYYGLALEADNPIAIVKHGSGIQIWADRLGAIELSSEYDQTPLEPSGVAVIYQTRSGPRWKGIRKAKVATDE